MFLFSCQAKSQNPPLLVSVLVLLWVSPTPSLWFPSRLEPCWVHSSPTAAVWGGGGRAVDSHISPQCITVWWVGHRTSEKPREVNRNPYELTKRQGQWTHWRWRKAPHTVPDIPVYLYIGHYLQECMMMSFAITMTSSCMQMTSACILAS